MIIVQQPFMLFLSVLALPLLYRAYVNKDMQWRLVSFTTAVLLVLLSLAAASPAIQQQSETVETSRLVYLNDESRSMIERGPNISLEDVSIDRRVLATGNSSELDKSLLNSVARNKTYLVRSDFQGLEDPGRVIDAYRNRNSSIYILADNLPEETAVEVEGPSVTVPGAENSFSVNLHSTEDSGKKVSVKIDGEDKLEREVDGSTEFTHRFQEKGYHRIRADVESDDVYNSNNVFYKTIKVIEKPEVLVVGESGRLDTKLSDFYEIERRSSLPEDLSPYYAVLLKKKLDSTAQLKPYLIDGNGLMYTGDRSMDVLPVRKTGSVDDETSNAKVAIIIDMSVASGKCAEQTCFGEESREKASIKPSKKFAYNVIYNLPKATRVSIGGYNDKFYNFSSFRSLAFHRDELMDIVSRIPVEGPSLHNAGLSGASRKIGDEGNIVLLTDGEVTGYGQNKNVKSKSYRIAENLPPDVKLFPVYMGEDEIPEFLEQLASRSDGKVYRKEEFYSSVPMFQGGGGSQSFQALSIVDSGHFITRNLGVLNTATASFDRVETRDSANLLVSSTGGRPALSTWRYGLGRVASFSAGGKELQNILSQEPGLVSRSASWVVGDPQRKGNSSVNIESGRLGEPVVITSERKFEGLSRKPGGGFETRIVPDSTGFHSFEGRTFSYNYREELQSLGYRESVAERVANNTGGKVVTPENIESIRNDIPVSKRSVTEQRSLSPVLLLAALLVFLFNVGYRKSRGLL